MTLHAVIGEAVCLSLFLMGGVWWDYRFWRGASSELFEGA